VFSRPLVQVTFPLAAANVMNQAARMVMAIVGPVIAVELGLSAVELGVLAASLFAAYAVAQLPLGVALDAFGARRVQTALMLLTAAGFAIFALSPGFAGLAAGRIILGVGISAGLMAVIKAHADWFDRARVAHVTGIATAIGALGSALTTSPVQALLPALGWRGIFWVLCLLALTAAIWIFLSVPDKPRAAVTARTLRGDIASSGRILASRTFWRFAPAVGTLSMFNFAYLGLWAGPWLRDVAGMDGPARAGLLFVYTFAMVAGSMLAGSAASRATAAGLSPFLVPIVALVGMVLLQAGLMLQPNQPAVVLALWLAIAVFGAAGPAGYIVLCQMFPPEQTGRVSTAVNTLTLGWAFLAQAAIGWILDLWPRTASDGWSPEGYSWALALTAALQALAALVMATAQRRGRGTSM
jgi:predicted MFS family arabinose efflux permease